MYTNNMLPGYRGKIDCVVYLGQYKAVTIEHSFIR